MSLDVLKLIILCAEHVDVSYNARVSKVIKGVIDN